MKLTLEFNDIEDDLRYKRAVFAEEAFDLIWEISQKIREILKYDGEINDKTLEDIQEMIYESRLLGLYQ